MQTRVYRLRKFLPSLLIAWLTVSGLTGSVARAAEPTVLKTVNFTSETYQRGFSFTLESGAKVVVAPGTFSGPAVLRVEKLESGIPTRAGQVRRSDVLRISVTGDSLTLRQPIQVDFPIPPTGFAASVGKLDEQAGTWEVLGSSLSANGSRLKTADDKIAFTVAAFQSAVRQEGRATYYGTYTRTTKLTMVAASNTFPKGQDVRVTNLDTNKTITVRIVDTGGFKYPRVIDLSTPAFAKLAPTWKGVINVRVEKATPWNRPASTPSEPTVPSGAAPTLDGATPPTTAAYASAVVDVASGQKLLGKKSDQAMPIASLTKLMTAAVVMDTKPNLAKVMTYDPAQDSAICSCLRLAAGEQVTVKDLLYASLVGSANNATLMLARSTGLSRAEFVARMNAKAKQLGLKNASFVEPTGLDPGNVASALDLATMARVIPQNGTIRKVTSTGSYTFKSKNTVCSSAYKRADGTCWHTFQTTNKLFGKTSFSIVAAKTGYIDEARHTFVLRGRDSRGHELVVVLLKTYTKADSFSGANALMNWTFQHATWK